MKLFGKKKKENPYSLKNKLKMVIKTVAEKERSNEFWKYIRRREKPELQKLFAKENTAEVSLVATTE